MRKKLPKSDQTGFDSFFVLIFLKSKWKKPFQSSQNVLYFSLSACRSGRDRI